MKTKGKGTFVPEPAKQPTKTGKDDQAFQGRKKAMQELVADSKRILDSLKTLSNEQKNAVVALMTITRATAAYESRLMKKDDAPLRAFYGHLSQFSSAYKATGKFQSLLNACFDASVACGRALTECLDSGRTESECYSSDPNVVVACANEARLMTEEFMKLHQGILLILGGRDPWPRQPFPY